MIKLSTQYPESPVLQGSTPDSQLKRNGDFADLLSSRHADQVPKTSASPSQVAARADGTNRSEGQGHPERNLGLNERSAAAGEEPVVAAIENTTLCYAVATLPFGVGEEPVWARVYAEHWFANGYLSIVDAAQQQTASQESPSERVVGNTVAKFSASVDMPTKVGIPLQERAPSDLGGDIGLVEEIPAETADRVVESLSSTLEQLMAADHPWPERLVRLSRNGQGVTTLWLRDYALKENTIDPLVQAVKDHARTKGIVVDRIVINGREVWKEPIEKGR